MRAIDKLKPREYNEIGNKKLKIQLADEALKLLVCGKDYNDFAYTKCEFGYLFDIRNHGIDALFKIETDKITAYFAIQGGKFMRLDFTEELFRSTSDGLFKKQQMDYIRKNPPSQPQPEPQPKYYSEGEGRAYGTGGEACYYCPDCVGSRDWCPYMDED